MKPSAKQKTFKLVELSIFVALIFIMQYLGTIASSPLKVAGIELSFVLVPIVIGAFLLGPLEGAFLGFVFGVMTIILTIVAPGSMLYILFDSNPVLFIVTAILKAILAGFGAGCLYKGLGKLFKGKYTYLKTLIASASAPIINTGIFLLGMCLFFNKTISETWAGGQNVFLFLVGLIGLNFIIEITINIVLTPAIIRIVEAIKKKVK